MESPEIRPPSNNPEQLQNAPRQQLTPQQRGDQQIDRLLKSIDDLGKRMQEIQTKDPSQLTPGERVLKRFMNFLDGQRGGPQRPQTPETARTTGATTEAARKWLAEQGNPDTNVLLRTVDASLTLGFAGLRTEQTVRNNNLNVRTITAAGMATEYMITQAKEASINRRYQTTRLSSIFTAGGEGTAELANIHIDAGNAPLNKALRDAAANGMTAKVAANGGVLELRYSNQVAATVDLRSDEPLEVRLQTAIEAANKQKESIEKQQAQTR